MKMLGIFCSDIHLSSKYPKKWDVEDRIVYQMKVLRKIGELAEDHQCDVFVAGDLFHKPADEPELVTEVITLLKQTDCTWWAIPGQHDLPGHNLSRMKESHFKTLIAAETLVYMNGLYAFDGFNVMGVPYGLPIPKITERRTIALLHTMVWEAEPFPGAPKSGNISSFLKKNPGYRFYVIGDNHQAFLKKNVLNCGAAIPRTIAEGKGFAYGIQEDFSVKRFPLPQPTFKKTQEEEQIPEKLRVFVNTLSEKEKQTISFKSILRALLEEEEPDSKIEKLIWEIIQEAEDNQ